MIYNILLLEFLKRCDLCLVLSKSISKSSTATNTSAVVLRLNYSYCISNTIHTVVDLLSVRSLYFSIIYSNSISNDLY